MPSKNIRFFLFGYVFLQLIITACNVTPVSVNQPTPTLFATNTPTEVPTTPIPPTDIPTATSTSTGTSTPTATNTSTTTATPTSTNSPTLAPTDTPTNTPSPIPLSTDTPTPSEPETSGPNYPSIPAGKGLIYIINFNGAEAQFRFFGQEEDFYLIPGTGAVSEGGILELFLDPGHYRWASLIPPANLSGEGELEITEGQIHGLGLTQGKVGPQDVIEGIWLGPNPLSPPEPPPPTPIPIAPTPAPGKVMLVVYVDGRSSEIFVYGQRMLIPMGQRGFFELDPGIEVVLSYEEALPPEMAEINRLNNFPTVFLLENKLDHELLANSTCEWFFTPGEHGGLSSNFHCE